MFYIICKNLLKLYKHFDFEFNEHILIIQGIILIKIGNIKEIPIQINVFSNVFEYFEILHQKKIITSKKISKI